MASVKIALTITMAGATILIGSLVQQLRGVDLQKAPGVSETLDWTAALVALGRDEPDAALLDLTLGVVLKDKDDQDAVRGERLASLLARADAARPRVD